MTENNIAIPTPAVPTVAEPNTMPLAEFLANTAPYTEHTISNYFQYQNSLGSYKHNLPRVFIHCNNSKCVEKGKLAFNPTTNCDYSVLAKQIQFRTFEYQCSNCQENIKIYSIIAINPSPNNPTQCIKLGEFPAYGPPIPSLLIKMVGKDRELFLKGRRCETQGLGIASFAYYRRVIEDQKNRLFDQIIKVTKLLEPDSELITELETAKAETQFTKSIDKIKTAIPQSLMISGHNPLTLLHSALSEGLHAHSDEDCLEIAGEVRVVLTVFAEKITEALNDNREVQDAVRKLAQRRATKAE